MFMVTDVNTRSVGLVRPGGDETANKFIGDVTISGSSLFSAASRWCPVEGGRPADLKSVIEGGKAFLNPDMSCESTDHIFCQSVSLQPMALSVDTPRLAFMQ